MAKGGFRGMPGGMNQAAMIKQAQKMQQEMLRMQEEMENKSYSASSGGGMVTAAVNGKHELLSLEIEEGKKGSVVRQVGVTILNSVFRFGLIERCVWARAKSLHSCLTLYNPMDYSLQAPLSVEFSKQEY